MSAPFTNVGTGGLVSLGDLFGGSSNKRKDAALNIATGGFHGLIDELFGGSSNRPTPQEIALRAERISSGSVPPLGDPTDPRFNPALLPLDLPGVVGARVEPTRPAIREAFPKRPKKALQDINIELALEQLRAVRVQSGFQDRINALVEPLLVELADEQRILNELIPPEERVAQQQASFEAANQLLQQQLQRLEKGATDFEREQIRIATESLIEQGASDIESAERDALNVIFEELSPALGLRPTDSPILDRASLVAREAARQRSQLARQARGFEASQLLQFPLQSGQLAEATRQFETLLQERAATNRLNLLGGAQQGGLGLVAAAPALSPLTTVTVPTVPGAGFANVAGGVGSILGSVGGAAGGIGAALAASSRQLKEDIIEVDPTWVLERLAKLPIYRWRYRAESLAHIGPMAEEFTETFGVGDGKALYAVDVMGVALAALRGIAEIQIGKR